MTLATQQDGPITLDNGNTYGYYFEIPSGVPVSFTVATINGSPLTLAKESDWYSDQTTIATNIDGLFVEYTILT